MRAEDLLALCKDVLADAGEAEAELNVRMTERGCARFAGGELGQHMELVEPQAVVRVAHGARVAGGAAGRGAGGARGAGGRPRGPAGGRPGRAGDPPRAAPRGPAASSRS